MLDLHGRLTQAFATTPGSLYTVSFAYTDNPVKTVAPGPAWREFASSTGWEIA